MFSSLPQFNSWLFLLSVAFTIMYFWHWIHAWFQRITHNNILVAQCCRMAVHQMAHFIFRCYQASGIMTTPVGMFKVLLLYDTKFKPTVKSTGYTYTYTMPKLNLTVLLPHPYPPLPTHVSNFLSISKSHSLSGLYTGAGQGEGLHGLVLLEELP